MSEQIVDAWLDRFVAAVLAHDLESHMDMISRDVLVSGVPGFDTLGFDDWYAQCAREFPQRLLTGLDYDRVAIRVSEGDRILFRSRETTRTTAGETGSQGVEMLLQREGGDWRLKELRLLPEDEARDDRLL